MSSVPLGGGPARNNSSGLLTAGLLGLAGDSGAGVEDRTGRRRHFGLSRGYGRRPRGRHDMGIPSFSKEREFLEFARTQANAIVGGKPATVWLQTDQGLIRFYEGTSIEKMGSSYKASVRLSVATKELSSYFPDGRFSDQPKSRFGDPTIYAESSSPHTGSSTSTSILWKRNTAV